MKKYVVNIEISFDTQEDEDKFMERFERIAKPVNCDYEYSSNNYFVEESE